MLLRAGADPNTADGQGRTPAVFAYTQEAMLASAVMERCFADLVRRLVYILDSSLTRP